MKLLSKKGLNSKLQEKTLALARGHRLCKMQTLVRTWLAAAWHASEVLSGLVAQRKNTRGANGTSHIVVVNATHECNMQCVCTT